VTGFIGGLLQAFAFGHLACFYIGRSVFNSVNPTDHDLLTYRIRFVEGVGLGAGTMLAPTYVAENSPRAIRGFLVGFFQLLLVMGGMMSYFINYGALLHLPVSQSCCARYSDHEDRLTQLIIAQGHLDGPTRMPVYLSSLALHQHALLSRITALPCRQRSMGCRRRGAF
jgi:MFS family permease